MVNQVWGIFLWGWLPWMFLFIEICFMPFFGAVSRMAWKRHALTYVMFFSGVWKEGAVLQFETGGFVKKSMLYFKVFLLFICSNSAENDKFGHYFWEGLKQKQQPLAFWWSIIKSNWLPWPLSDSFFQHFSNTGSIFKPGRSFVRWRGFFAYCMCCTRIKGSLRRCVLAKHPRLDHLAI